MWIDNIYYSKSKNKNGSNVSIDMAPELVTANCFGCLCSYFFCTEILVVFSQIQRIRSNCNLCWFSQSILLSVLEYWAVTFHLSKSCLLWQKHVLLERMCPVSREWIQSVDADPNVWIFQPIVFLLTFCWFSIQTAFRRCKNS